MTTEPEFLLPAQLAQPSLNVRSSRTHCNCGNRWTCDWCRNAWIARRKRSNLKWLSDANGSDARSWFCTFTVAVSEDIRADMEMLWGRWSELGRQRSLSRSRTVLKGLGLISRGFAAMHLLNRYEGWQPHLHAIIIADRTLEPDVVIEFWQERGGYADVEEVRSLGAVVHYSIADPCQKTNAIERY